jgi:Domain of unknown function (DUF4115)
MAPAGVDAEGAAQSTTGVDDKEPQRTPFDEGAALEELERLARDIARYRAQREAFGQEFDSFLRPFKTGPEGAAPRAPAVRTRAREVAGVTEPSPAEPPGPPPPAPLPESTVVSSPPPADRSEATDSPAAVPLELRAPAARARASWATSALLGGALIVILAGGLIVRSLSKPAPESPPPSVAPDAPAAASAPVPAPAAAPPPAVAAAAASSESAITTVRRVWMRVIVDGERVVEREVPAGTRVPLNAEKTIVIRTGDAGAVRLAIRGEDRGVLGGEGEVVTRSFAVPPRRAPAGR